MTAETWGGVIYNARRSRPQSRRTESAWSAPQRRDRPARPPPMRGSGAPDRPSSPLEPADGGRGSIRNRPDRKPRAGGSIQSPRYPSSARRYANDRGGRRGNGQTSKRASAHAAARYPAGVPTAWRVRPPARQDSISARSEEHTSELQSLMRISYAVFCLKQKNKQ